ncbi:hypothetical protein JTE90_003067, partial [Oedothorax gibbosus]
MLGPPFQGSPEEFNSTLNILAKLEEIIRTSDISKCNK